MKFFAVFSTYSPKYDDISCILYIYKLILIEFRH